METDIQQLMELSWAKAEVAAENVPGGGNNLGKGPEGASPRTAKRPKGLSGKSKRKQGETRDVSRGPILCSLGGHNKVLVFIMRTIWQPVVHDE